MTTPRKPNHGSSNSWDRARAGRIAAKRSPWGASPHCSTKRAQQVREEISRKVAK